ncbi:hypothetical protein M0804_004450 [Polistes exclamans]|nr:hypothetical protein M0804_004450 [Polistes exclamans]
MCLRARKAITRPTVQFICACSCSNWSSCPGGQHANGKEGRNEGETNNENETELNETKRNGTERKSYAFDAKRALHLDSCNSWLRVSTFCRDIWQNEDEEEEWKGTMRRVTEHHRERSQTTEKSNDDGVGTSEMGIHSSEETADKR